MTLTLEERVRRLEGFRYRALGHINAHSTLLADLWTNVIANSGRERASELLESLSKQWLSDADKPPQMPGVEPAHLDLISQEYRAALETLIGAMRQKLLAGPTTGSVGKSGQ